jgi:hypothetical protein
VGPEVCEAEREHGTLHKFPELRGNHLGMGAGDGVMEWWRAKIHRRARNDSQFVAGLVTDALTICCSPPLHSE